MDRQHRRGGRRGHVDDPDRRVGRQSQGRRAPAIALGTLLSSPMRVWIFWKDIDWRIVRWSAR
jgi:hypothetical protein